MATTINLSFYKKKLVDALGDSFKEYLANMKLWFQQKRTKEEFDFEARKLLNAETVHCHNEFMLALLNKCHIQASSHMNRGSSSSQSHSAIKEKLKKSCLKKKSRPVRGTNEHRLKPEYPLNHAPQLVSRDPSEDTKISFCAREATLPDVNMVHGRMFVTAWDCGLDSVESDAVKVLMIAIEMQLKSILVEMFSQRKSYKLREGCFRYSLNSGSLNPYISNTSNFKDSADFSETTSFLSNADHVPCSPIPHNMAEGFAAHEVSCSISNPRSFQPVSLYDLFNTLKVKRNMISSHSVYAVNMERISVKLSHPSHEELEQESIHQQEKRLREEIKSKQAITI